MKESTTKRISTIIAGESTKAVTTLKVRNMDIVADKRLSLIEEEEDSSQIIDNSVLPPEQNLTNIIEADNFVTQFISEKKQSDKGSGKK